VAAEVTRSIFKTVRQEHEAFSVYGERASFEWQLLGTTQRNLDRGYVRLKRLLETGSAT
jgi:hypothetical protein